MKIAITGASGRVGNAILELALTQGHTVVSIDRLPPPEGQSKAGVSFVQADVTHYDEFEAAMRGCDALIHMAAIPSPGHHPDHVPTVEGDNNDNAGYSSFGRLYAIGYIRGLRQAVYGD